ncbi:hypothetical protein SeMB42_g01274 [Synchytrium endobioticum]|nr:hypothetical protein SeMB42_g01274 [Synchytrium endobioticum]
MAANRCVYATLLSDASYLVGVQVLAASLQRNESVHRLVVLITDNLEYDDLARCLCKQSIVECRRVTPLHVGCADGAQTAYAFQRFENVWSKLNVFNLVEYDKVCLMDADMLTLHNMDEVFAYLPAGATTIAAAPACVCNVTSNPSYPAHWHPSNCLHTYNGAGIRAPATLPRREFNSGLVVLKPSVAVFSHMVAALSAKSDLSAYSFADQDFLNELFPGWIELPYVYNALKTLSVHHADVWRMDQVKNVHYILEKPWKVHPETNKEEFEASPYKTLNQIWWDVYKTIVSMHA